VGRRATSWPGAIGGEVDLLDEAKEVLVEEKEAGSRANAQIDGRDDSHTYFRRYKAKAMNGMNGI